MVRAERVPGGPAKRPDQLVERASEKPTSLTVTDAAPAPAQRRSASRASIPYLQRAAGNAAVRQLLARPTLVTGTPGVVAAEGDGVAPVQREETGAAATPAPVPASSSTPEPPRQPALPTSIPGVAEQLSAEKVAAWRANESAGFDSSLFQILKGPFGANWFRTKAVLAQNQWPALPASIDKSQLHGPAVSLMTGMVEMRAAAFSDVKRLTLERLPTSVTAGANARTANAPPAPAPADPVAARLRREAETPDALMEFKGSVGSDTVTSDVDVATGGTNSELGVKLFNEAFRQRAALPYDAGTVFDLNVYALDFMHGKPTVDEAAKTLAPGAKEHTALGTGELAAAAAERTDDQEIWSLVHQRRYMTGPEWSAYVAATTDAIANPVAKENKRRKLETANSRYEAFESRVEHRMRDMQAEVDLATAAFTGAAPGGADHFHEDARRLRASNALYEQTIAEVKELRLRMALLQDELGANVPTGDLARRYANLATQIASKISEGLTFANEVYSTEGSTLHVVIGMQTGTKKTAELRAANKLGANESLRVDLPRSYYVQSFNEQVGDSLKDLTHYASQPSYAAYRAGKYIDRMCIAARQLAPSIVEDRDFAELRALGDVHLAAKKSRRTAEEAEAKVPAADPSVGDDPTRVDAHPTFGAFTADSLATLRARVNALAAKVTQVVDRSPSARADVPRTTSSGTSGSAATPPPAPEQSPVELLAAARARLRSIKQGSKELVAAEPPK